VLVADMCKLPKTSNLFRNGTGKTQKPVFLEEYSCYMGYSDKVMD